VLMMFNLTTVPIRVAFKLFALADNDNNGTIEHHEFTHLVTMAPNAFDQALKNYMKRNPESGIRVSTMDTNIDVNLQRWLDENGLTVLDADLPASDREIMRAQRVIREHVSTQFEHVQKFFRLADEDHSGMVSKTEILRVLMLFQLKDIPVRVFTKYFAIIDTNHDNLISYDEFAKALQMTDKQFKAAMEEHIRFTRTKDITRASVNTEVDPELSWWLKSHNLHMDPRAANAPATDAEILAAQQEIRQHVIDRSAHLEKVFRVIDEDHSGKISRTESLRILMIFNLTQIPVRVFNKLITIADGDSSNEIDFEEFCRLMTMDESQFMSAIRAAKRKGVLHG